MRFQDLYSHCDTPKALFSAGLSTTLGSMHNITGSGPGAPSPAYEHPPLLKKNSSSNNNYDNPDKLPPRFKEYHHIIIYQ